MSETNQSLKIIRESSGFRLAILFGSFFIFLLLSSFFSLIIDNLDLGSERTRILLSSSVQCILAFCIPSIILARFSSNKWAEWLELTKIPKLRSIFGVVIVYILSLPAMEWLIEWNSNLHFTEKFSEIESTLRAWEESAENTTKILLEANGWTSVLSGIIIIGILTGFSEELFFRGGLQGLLTRGGLNKNLCVWLAAMVFSMMHFQFFGFVPRLLMGAFFGYLLIWTRRIWVPVFAHILNNSVVVISAALSGDLESSIFSGETTPIDLGNSFMVILSIVLTTLFLLFFKDIIFKAPTSKRISWLKRTLHPISER